MAQAGINTSDDRQREAVAAVQQAARRVAVMIREAGESAAVQERAVAANDEAQRISAGRTPATITQALSHYADAASALVADFLSVDPTSEARLDISAAPELRDSLTLDPAQGVVQACLVLPSGCREEAHPSYAGQTNIVGTAQDFAPAPLTEPMVQPSCTTTAGMRVRVIYGYYTFSGAPGNRASSYARDIANMMAETESYINNSAAKQSGTKKVRFLMNADCTLSISSVALPQTAYNFGSSSTAFDAMVTTLKNAGYGSTTTKYVVMTDNPGNNTGCGLGSIYNDNRPDPLLNLANGHSTQVGYAQISKGCWDDKRKALVGVQYQYIGYPYLGAEATMHELGHVLGAVQPTSPYSTAGYHCYDGTDRMCYPDGSTRSNLYDANYCNATNQGSNPDHLWDCGNDDYFARTPAAGSWLSTHWNLYRSGFLY